MIDVDELEEARIHTRAMALAEVVSEVIWGGEHGWEYATTEQFVYLKRRCRELLVDGMKNEHR